MEKYTRSDGRSPGQLRKIRITPDYTRYAEGCALIELGGTRVLCTASVEERTAPFLIGTGRGWVTAEYAMLPRATHTRSPRDISKLRLSSRSAEIQRLLGRSLRCVCDMSLLGERTIVVDCDVLQADGGTRTASVTGGYVALALAMDRLVRDGVLPQSPLTGQVAAVSVGMVDGRALLDLCYDEDSRADVDMNIVMTGEGGLVEVQGTGEGRAFSRVEMSSLMTLARRGIARLLAEQRRVLAGRTGTGGRV